MKKLFLLPITILIIAGCSKGDNNQKTNPPVSNLNESAISSETSHQEIENSAPQDEKTSQYPYAVNVEELFDRKTSEYSYHPYSTFRTDSVNAPQIFRIERYDDSNLQMKVFFESYTEEYGKEINRIGWFTVTAKNVPTKEIAIFNGPGMGPGKRTVKVNTELELHVVDDIESRIELAQHKYYLFHNSKGTISLIVHNFAGNIGIEDIDTMAEYVLLDPEDEPF